MTPTNLLANLSRCLRCLPPGAQSEAQTYILATGLGMNGCDWIADTNDHAGSWAILHAVTDCVISKMTFTDGFQSGSTANVPVKAGDRIYGPIVALTLVSGTAILYRA